VVQVSGLGFATAFTVTAGQTTTVLLPQVQLGFSEGVYNVGIHVQALNPVSVKGIDFATATTDGYRGLPVNALGTD